jgi:two-component system chemotaxis response regulator CheB
MGRDGAQGIVALSGAGAPTIAQDETTSYVYGMPKAAFETGHVRYVLPLTKIPGAIAQLIQGKHPARVVAR